MRHALVNGQLTLANPAAPATAACPSCGGPVELRNRQGTYFWRHVQLPRGGCRPQPASAPAPVLSAVEDDAVIVDSRQRHVRQVGDLVIELHPGDDDAYGRHLKLRRLGLPSEMIVRLSEARLLAWTLLEAVADLVGVVIGDREER